MDMLMPKYRWWFMFGAKRPHRVWRRDNARWRGDASGSAAPLGGPYGFHHGQPNGDSDNSGGKDGGGV